MTAAPEGIVVVCDDGDLIPCTPIWIGQEDEDGQAINVWRAIPDREPHGQWTVRIAVLPGYTEVRLAHPEVRAEEEQA